jgi:hypothetical protein
MTERFGQDAWLSNFEMTNVRLAKGKLHEIGATYLQLYAELIDALLARMCAYPNTPHASSRE